MKHDDALDALIATAKAKDVPPEGAEDQAWAAFAGSLGGGGGGSDVPVAEVATAAKGVGLAIKVAVGVALASAAAVGVVRWSAAEPEPHAGPSVSSERSPAPASVVPPPPRAAAPPVSVGVAPVAAPELPSEPEPVARAARVRSLDASAGAQREPIAPASASTLAEEARLVGSMWKALDLDDAAQALSLAKSHGVRFEGGALELEARAAALAARCVLGRPTDLREFEAVQKAATPSVAKRVSAACAKKP